MSERITFHAETGNRTIVLSPNVRIIQGKNNMAAEVIEEYGLADYPFITMPPDYKKSSGKEEIVGRTTAESPVVQVTDEPRELKTVADEVKAEKPVEDNDEPNTDAPVKTVDDAVARGKKMQDDIKKGMWSAARVIAMDLPRAKKAVAEQDNVQKLVELYQIAQSKPQLAKVVKARILTLDPDNTFIRKDANDK